MNFKISGGNKNACIELKQKKDGDILYLTVSMTLPSPEIPEPFRIEWNFSARDCTSTWNPSLLDIHGLAFEWGKLQIKSRLASWMPVQSLISNEGRNRLCIAVSDVDTPVSIRTGLREEDATFACEVEFFILPAAPAKEYTAVIRLDMRDIPYYDSIYDTADWWENEWGYKPAHVPESAKNPMDSLWYSFHQMLDRDEILKECRASREIGLETVIIDDGWQTDDNNRGYAYCGDWQVAPKKMGDMASLVEEIHKIGMKVILWYSVPFMGIYAEKFREFEGMLLEGSGDDKTFFGLDPRYKKVREYLVSIYKNAVADWRLDGLKLDFIDSFVLKGKSLLPDPKRDCQSLENAIHLLMSEIRRELIAINPEIMIEFRQSYVGPSIRKYGNMLRVGDCPCDILKNRVGIINLRMTSGKTAVHSDMIMWSVEDTAENAAMQFASILYGVPQVSVRVDKLPEDHRRMLEYYVSFWKEHKDVLLEGRLTAENPECNYSSASSVLRDKAVITLFTTPVARITTDEAVIVNASMHTELIIIGAQGRAYRIVNCMGEETASGTVAANLTAIPVPKAGMVFVKTLSE
ncbi:MAG: alpha-galactosidase [Clostridia bacterium]|nr:alpha-galactosidase [Clostridia bacterium]